MSNQIADYRSRFGLHTTPFTREIRVQDRYLMADNEKVLKRLLGAVQERMSAALIAPPGTGKTTLLRALIDHLPETRYRLHYVKVTDLSKRDLCREVAAAMGCDFAGTYPSLVRRLQERFAATLDSDGLRPVLVLDEAHDIRPEVLGILRLLTNYEMDSRLVVSILLAGQSPLAKLLGHEKLRDVAQRLAHYATLKPLSRAETKGYLEHRCRIAGASSCPFDRRAIESIYELGRGNMRATGHLARKALELAHEAGSDTVDPNHVIEARGMVVCA